MKIGEPTEEDREKVHTAVPDALDRLDKDQPENDEFELEQKELNGVINPMMNVYIAAGGGDMTGGRHEMQARRSGNASGNQPTLQLGTSFRDRPRVKHMSTYNHTTHELSILSGTTNETRRAKTCGI